MQEAEAKLERRRGPDTLAKLGRRAAPSFGWRLVSRS